MLSNSLSKHSVTFCQIGQMSFLTWVQLLLASLKFAVLATKGWNAPRDTTQKCLSERLRVLEDGSEVLRSQVQSLVNFEVQPQDESLMDCKKWTSSVTHQIIQCVRGKLETYQNLGLALLLLPSYSHWRFLRPRGATETLPGELVVWWVHLCRCLNIWFKSYNLVKWWISTRYPEHFCMHVPVCIHHRESRWGLWRSRCKFHLEFWVS